jgi:hypothetical protein
MPIEPRELVMEPRFNAIEVRVHTLSELIDGERHFLAHNLPQIEQELVCFH